MFGALGGRKSTQWQQTDRTPGLRPLMSCCREMMRKTGGPLLVRDVNLPEFRVDFCGSGDAATADVQ